MSQSENHIKHRMAEAASYALMRRIAPAIRHNMAGALQPVGMIAAMLERRLQMPSSDVAQLIKSSHDIGVLSREAAGSCMDLMAWFSPKNKDVVPVNLGIEEAVGLMATELSFKGFSISNETGAVDLMVPRQVVRSVFLGCLIALTDSVQLPATVVLRAHSSEGALHLELMLIPMDGVSSRINSVIYRSLDWADVQALADSEKVVISVSDNAVEMHYADASVQE